MIDRNPTLRSLIPAIALALATTGGALAHSKSETTTPADGASVEAVEALEMRFDGPMRIIKVTLTSNDEGIEVERETGMEPVTEFRAVPASDLAPGAYEVEWRGMSADGHPMQGAFGFTVAE